MLESLIDPPEILVEVLMTLVVPIESTSRNAWLAAIPRRDDATVVHVEAYLDQEFLSDFGIASATPEPLSTCNAGTLF